MAEENKALLDEMRQPYKTPSERAADRKARAQPGLFNTAPERPEDAPAPVVAITVWRIQRQADLSQIAYVRCPSRSGAKIFMHDQHGWSGPFWTEVADDDEIARAKALGLPIYDAVFETVPEYAERIAAEKKGR